VRDDWLDIDAAPISIVVRRRHGIFDRVVCADINVKPLANVRQCTPKDNFFEDLSKGKEIR
jgi:hypothetical protein